MAASVPRTCIISLRLLSRKLRLLPMTCRTLASGVPPRPGPTQSEVRYLKRSNGNRLAYRILAGNNPGIIFCPGFQSNMLGIKAMALEEYCRQKGLAYTRFDYQGCGESEGDLTEVTMTDWKSDIVSVIDQVTAGPQVLVGSSLGGWLMFTAALERRHRVHSLVGIATAADFPNWENRYYPPEIKKSLLEFGQAVYENEFGKYVLTRHMLEDAQKYNILAQKEINITCPVRLLHGMKDHYIPYQQSVDLAEKLWTPDVDVILRKDGDHRLSQPGDICALFEVLEQLIYGTKDTRDLAVTSWHSFSVYSYPSITTTKKSES